MRPYIVFGSSDGKVWETLGTIQAASHNNAMGHFVEQEFKQYAACPLRNWASATPQIKQRAPVVTWAKVDSEPTEIDPNQLGLDTETKESPAQVAKRLRQDLVEERTP